MKILVACEYSGTVREAFKKRGHDAWSCDILPTDIPGLHIQDDVLKVLNLGWDMMIAHPPCTYLSAAGERWFNIDKYGEQAKQRLENRILAKEFVLKLYNSNISKICIENPVGWLNSNWKKPDQIIQPYYFGETESKRTCLWLKNLSKLVSTNIVQPKVHAYFKNGPKIGQPIYWCSYGGGKNHSHYRSKTFKGIADAMAEQWG